MSIDYKSWYASAKAELKRVQNERIELERSIGDRDKQIAALIQTLNAIAPLVGEAPVVEPPRDATEGCPKGLTDCIRTILQQTTEPLSAAQIRDRLEQMGFDMGSYSNPLANIHTIVKRLEPLLVEVPLPGGKKVQVPLGKRFKVGKTEITIGAMKGFKGQAKHE